MSQKNSKVHNGYTFLKRNTYSLRLSIMKEIMMNWISM